MIVGLAKALELSPGVNITPPTIYDVYADVPELELT